MNLTSNINVTDMLSSGAEIAFYVLLLIFTIHAVFLGYHWFNYGTKKRTGLIALAVYLWGGATLFITLAILLGKI